MTVLVERVQDVKISELLDFEDAGSAFENTQLPPYAVEDMFSHYSLC